MLRIKIKLVLLAALLPLCSKAEIKLCHLFSNQMVMQRDQPLKVWGQGAPGEKVTLEFRGKCMQTKASKGGNWQVTLPAMPHGGPYEMTVSGKNNTIVVQDILIGDVWFCAGQSNMEMKLSGAENSVQEIAKADYPQIRTFNVPREISYEPRSDVKAGWLVCSPQTADKFSAVSYYFAKKIYEETGIPIGIINASWGGTSIESWTALEVYNSLPEEIKEKGKTGPLIAPLVYFAENEKNRLAYEKALLEDKGMDQQWFRPAMTVADWKPIQVPQSWNQNELQSVDGIIWLRYNAQLPKEVSGEMACLSLGTIGDEDVTWVNGQQVGTTTDKFASREYFVPPGLLKAGTNTIVVKVTDNGINGGINGKAEDVCIRTARQTYSLAGAWMYKTAVSSKDYHYRNIWRNDYPSLTYNSMLHPFLNYAIKGVLWYQGEQNTGKAASYSVLLPNLIKDWRKKWGYEFPFCVVQLPNFRKQDAQPQPGSQWAEFREAQNSALTLPQTGIVVTIDLGEAGDIHPRNKKDVGTRSALLALRQTYGHTDMVSSGPTYRSFEVRGNKVYLSFSDIGSGLISSDKYGYVKGFTLSGKNQKPVWANACIEGDQVVVYSELVDVPTAVTYNWADNPDGTLYNKEGLPAHSFRMNLIHK